MAVTATRTYPEIDMDDGVDHEGAVEAALMKGFLAKVSYSYALGQYVDRRNEEVNERLRRVRDDMRWLIDHYWDARGTA